MIRIFCCFLLAGAALSQLPPAWAQVPAQEPAAQGPAVKGTLSASSFGVGQSVVLSYVVTGSDADLEAFPQTIEVPGLSIVFSGKSQRISIENGVRRMEIGVRYMVQGSDAGEYEIPAQTFSVNGQVLQSEPVKVVIAEGDPIDDTMVPNVQLKLGKTEFWKGEVIPVEVAILVHPAVQPLSPFFPQIKTPNFAVNRFDRSAGLEAREVNGQLWRAWQMDSVLTALQSGAHQVGPAEIKAELLIPEPGANFDPFGGRQQGDRRSITLTSNTVGVNVKELPMAGKPDDFSGAVGEFEMETEASPVTLRAGDPIAVELVINGTGNFDAVTAPKLETTDGWRLYEPRISQENRAWGTEYGQKRFTQILIPEKSLTEIPPFVLHFFNPATATYVTRRSAPIALTVTGEFKPAGDPTAGSKDFAAPPDAAPPVEELGDIVDRPLTSGSWISLAAAPAPVNPALLHGVPAALLALLVAGGIRRRLLAAAAARRPAENAPRELWQILADLRRGTPDRRQFYRLIHEYLTSAPTHLKRSPNAGPALAELTTNRDRWLYGPETPETRQPLPDDERRRALESLSQL